MRAYFSGYFGDLSQGISQLGGLFQTNSTKKPFKMTVKFSAAANCASQGIVGNNPEISWAHPPKNTKSFLILALRKRE